MNADRKRLDEIAECAIGCAFTVGQFVAFISPRSLCPNRNSHLHRTEPVDALRLLHDLDHLEARRDRFPEDPQPRFGEAAAGAAMDGEFQRQTLRGRARLMIIRIGSPIASASRFADSTSPPYRPT
jgi:hypothetical protein